LVATLATSWLLGASSARAQVTTEPSAAIFPDPNTFARGLYTEGEIGVVGFFGRAGNVIAGARCGYDLFRFFALEARALGSTHETKGDTPVSGQLLQTYQGTIGGKLTLRLVQWSFFAQGAIGATRMSSNLLHALGLATYRTGLATGGGGGVDYHTLSRHVSVGARAEFYRLIHVEGSSDLIVTTYLRYTF
jgi:hypothetical protein